MVKLALNGLNMMFTGLNLGAFTHACVKIENGVVFIKPVTGVSKGRLGADTFPIDHKHDGQATCCIEGVLVTRVEAYLISRGWASGTSFLPLHLASRGWYGMSFDAIPVPTAGAVGVEIAGVYGPSKALHRTTSLRTARKVQHLVARRRQNASDTVSNSL
jgi:hypothetical protein